MLEKASASNRAMPSLTLTKVLGGVVDSFAETLVLALSKSG